MKTFDKVRLFVCYYIGICLIENFCLNLTILNYFLFQLYSVSQIQQGRQMEPVLRLYSPLSAKFSRHCVLSGETQRRALPCFQKYKKKIYFTPLTWNRTHIHPVYIQTLLPLSYDDLTIQFLHNISNKYSQSLQYSPITMVLKLSGLTSRIHASANQYSA